MVELMAVFISSLLIQALYNVSATHSPIHTASYHAGVWGELLGFSVLLRDTSTCGLEELETEFQTMRSVDDPLYHWVTAALIVLCQKSSVKRPDCLFSQPTSFQSSTSRVCCYARLPWLLAIQKKPFEYGLNALLQVQRGENTLLTALTFWSLGLAISDYITLHFVFIG